VRVPLVILLVVVGLVLVGVAAFVVYQRRNGGRRLPLEPPPVTRDLDAGAARSTTQSPPSAAPASAGGVVVVEDHLEKGQPDPGRIFHDGDGHGEALGKIETDLAPNELNTNESAVEAPSFEDAVVAEPVLEEIVRPRFRDRLAKARGLLGGYFGSVLGRSTIDQETWDELEEALVRADVGIGTTTSLLDDLKKYVKAESIKDPAALMDRLKSDLKDRLAKGDRELHFEKGRPNVWLFVGVNGVGKTTTIGKIGKRETANGRTIIMAAGDTFRAAAAEQLGMWAERCGAQLVRGNEGGDPGSVIFDAVERAAAKQVDLVLGDTAGRLQTKTNLMEELRKIRRIADKEPGKVTEVLLVLDATTGQNGLVQAKQFSDVAELTGVVLTKLDGTAKGGIAFAIETELGIPVKLVGLGEGVDDLIPFEPNEYVEALFA
jgi:fused signal recognition particle receptor